MPTKQVALALALWATPAMADTTAVYKSATGAFEMKVEVASNGNVRGEVVGRKAYFLTVGGEGYFVLQTPDGPVVDSVSDIGLAAADAFETILAKNPELRDAMKGAPSIQVIEKGTAVVNGRTGKAYYFDLGERISPQPVAVISNDPALAELGAAMALQFEMSLRIAPPGFGSAAFSGQMAKVLRTGAPLSFGGGDLVSVNNAVLSQDRFVLPAKPESAEKVLQRFKASGGHIP